MHTNNSAGISLLGIGKTRIIGRSARLGLLAGMFAFAYFISWRLLRPAGLVHPMANLRYFYFGSEPGSRLDVSLYYCYLPAYRIFGESTYGIHHSERRDP
jgi:hypothetical protein